MKKLFTSLLGIIIFSSCQDKSLKNTEPENETIEITNTTTVKKQLLRFSGNKILDKKDTLLFEADTNDIVNITLTVPKDSGNIRINQIIAPDNTANGPFGRTYNDTLHLSGTYRIIIGSSLMQESPYAGPYDVKVSFKK
ncbi:hypothetical protein NU10_12355 [Flavobacterium dauae]|uniref:hypothetical protein n=1 Tax=Flavobacterium dauae TaxID=1563479 RepID=UPI00101B4ECB|nr:hypothetical protein [Flavobacterium dauae]WLD23488.1 hypothetical protein NU10_12355 [Flavobacterium dauae]